MPKTAEAAVETIIVAKVAIRTARYATTWSEDKVLDFATNLMAVFGWQAADLSSQAFGDCLRAWDRMPSTIAQHG